VLQPNVTLQIPDARQNRPANVALGQTTMNVLVHGQRFLIDKLFVALCAMVRFRFGKREGGGGLGGRPFARRICGGETERKKKRNTKKAGFELGQQTLRK
jgi:hypothetical protein